MDGKYLAIKARFLVTINVIKVQYIYLRMTHASLNYEIVRKYQPMLILFKI